MFVNHAPAVFAVLPAVILLCAVGGLYATIRGQVGGRRLARSGTRTTGTVTRSRQHRSGGGEDATTSWRTEMIRFSLPDGQVVTGRPWRSDVGDTDRTGQHVVVMYDPARPGRFVAPRDGERLGLGVPTVSMALVEVLAIALTLTFLVRTALDLTAAAA